MSTAVDIARSVGTRSARSVHLFAALADPGVSPETASFLAKHHVVPGRILPLLEAEADTNDDFANSSPKALETALVATSESAPRFVPVKGRLRYQQASATKRVAERKRVATERCREAQRLLASRANQQPELVKLADTYARALSSLRTDRGVYPLFLAGIDLENLLRVRAQAPPDVERNPPLDADILFAMQSLIVAHGGLLQLFPDANQLIIELDQYRQQSEALDALRNRILDPPLNALAQSSDLFDDETNRLVLAVQDVDRLSVPVQTPTRGGTAVKHAWLRGALAAIGTYTLKQLRGIGAAARDEAVRDEHKLAMLMTGMRHFRH